MLRSVYRLLKFFSYTLILLLGVTLAISNRGRIDLVLYPLPYAFNVPIFLFSILLLALGIIIGSGISHLKIFKHRRLHKNATKRISALENEIGGLRSQHLHTSTRSLPHS